MMSLSARCSVLFGLLTLLAGCSGDYSDLDDFMDEVRARPAGIIKPIPPFKSYKAFNYSASGLRSPFSPPTDVNEVTGTTPTSTTTPIEGRPKEYLEQFALDTLAMVGTVEMGRTRWALIKDGEGSVSRVKRGNYLGRNHGKITNIDENFITLVEIVRNGSSGWIERPRNLDLRVPK